MYSREARPRAARGWLANPGYSRRRDSMALALARRLRRLRTPLRVLHSPERFLATSPPRPWEEEAARRKENDDAAAIHRHQPCHRGTVAIGCDHMARERKAQLLDHLEGLGYDVQDVGTHSDERCDYPVFVRAVHCSLCTAQSRYVA